MEDKTLKFGIVGAGFIVKEFLENVKLLPKVSVAGIYSRTYANAVEIAKAHEIPNVYSNFEDLLKSDVDAIYVATQNNTHFMYSQRSLLAGKHVLCEKPACVNFQQLFELLNLAEEKKLKFMEAMRFLYIPVYMELKKILATKIFGDIISIEGSLGKISQRTYRHTQDLNGGATLDLGIYPITAIIDILGFPDNIIAGCVKNEHGVDSSMSAIFTYKSGHIANIHASFTSLTRGELRICTEKGVITIPKYWTTGNKIVLENPKGKKETLPVILKGTGMADEIEHFRTTNREMLQGDLSIQVVRAMDKIREQIDVIFDVDK
ncbi:MAG: Gfo/Idh/MocA family oxidoreductase [Alphaproteobacteria bacterium]|jgi:predicted dehydrogenase|nr:Gfo/Idh/MocA family oxidoreductase [Alphaproteobacteria bacterium]